MVFQCPTCKKVLSSKQSLKTHMNKKKPCVAKVKNTKFKCEKCLVCFSSKQSLKTHMNKKNPCVKQEIKEIEEIKELSPYEKEMKFELEKEQMLGMMKREYLDEVKRVNRQFKNIQSRINERKKLKKKYNENVYNLNRRKTLPPTIPSIKRQPLEKNEKTETLMLYVKMIEKRLKIAKIQLDKLGDDIGDDELSNLQGVLDKMEEDRFKLHYIKKELHKRKMV